MPGGSVPRLREGMLVKGRWRIQQSLGHGAFGSVYVVDDTEGTGAAGQLAMKTEDRSATAQILKMEIAVLKGLSKTKAKHACRLHARGRTPQLNFVVMTLTWKSLQQLRKARPGSPKAFSLPTALRVGLQCAEALEELHNAGFLHRDVKPGNFSVGRKELTQHHHIYILDFGLARRYVDKKGTLRTPRESTGFRGTVRYAPMACHRREELARKDDMESWLYQQVELQAGQLPWHALSDKAEVGAAKKSARSEGSLFEGSMMPLAPLLDYLDSLHFVDKPDYDYIRGLFAALLKREHVGPDSPPFDWD